MKLKAYRVGKRVGLIRFDVKRNKDIIDRGRIIARRIGWNTFAENGRIIFEVIYAVRLDDGGLVECKHEQLWAKVWKEEK